MDIASINQFLETVILSYGQAFTLTLGSVLGSLSIILFSWLIGRQIRKILNKPSFLKTIPPGDPKRASLIKNSRMVIWPLGIFLAILNLGINIKSILDFVIPIPGLDDSSNTLKIANLVIVGLIILLTRISVYYIHQLLVKLGESNRIPMDQGRRLAVYQIFKYLIYILAFLLILANLPIGNLRGLLVGSAAIFVGVGLAMQQTFADIASGIMILFDGTVEIGDVVYVNSLDLEGEVVEIRLRTSIVETLDSVSVIVPNSKLTSTNVVNWKFNDRETRFRVNIGVAYGSNVQHVRKVLVASAESHGLILKHPAPRVRFVDFGESSLDFELLFWTNKLKDHEDIKSDLRFKIEAEFRRKGIEIPFPQRDLHIRSDIRSKLELLMAENDVVKGEKGDEENS